MLRPFLVAALYIAFVLAVALVALSAQSDASRALPSSTAPHVAALMSNEPGVSLDSPTPYPSSVGAEAPIDQLPVRSAAPTTAPSLRVSGGGLLIASRSVLPAPTPMPRSFLVGTATYYTPQPGWFGAAGPALRRALGDWRGQTVMVCGFGGGVTRCRPILLSDWCACGQGHLIDLTESAWTFVCGLPLSAGVCKVEVQLP